MSNINEEVPVGLKNWFFVHFVADILFAIPIFIAPVFTLKLMGWETVDPFASRLVAAALFGIGIESFLCRNSTLSAFRNMLNLKIIWSLSAIAGIIISLVQEPRKEPLFGWLLALVFILFNFLWIYWRVRIDKKGL